MSESQFQNYLSTITTAFENVNIKGRSQIDPNFFVYINKHPYYRALCKLQSIKKSEESTKLYAEDALSIFDDIETTEENEENKENETTHNYDISSVDCSNWQQSTEIYPFDYVASFETYNPFEDDNFMDHVKESLNDLSEPCSMKNQNFQHVPFTNNKGKRMVRNVKKSGIIVYQEVGNSTITENEEKQHFLSEELRMNIKNKIKDNVINIDDNIENIFL
uniref:SURP motif domain-containing protein n=1 Tax=Strongyloides papillosus TaxID=174720 RepID=A0A0N5C7D0_STREA